ncbi:acid phosphatase [Paenirhodobacter populi]|uniref:Phosphatase PAP2 family protein n=1 Tax=Paenirhodobacter populi TaxID=2306993 RepID=A0A443J4S0_9RHOB|nr:phosphatase PAP2 family protein [Sinirhodobacter populi]RWR15437.1 phosphatase PAP2 family protein [Sinirhodobacter populi]
MKHSLTISTALVAGLLAVSPALAWQAVAPAQIAPVADTVTPANADPAYRGLLDDAAKGLIAALDASAKAPLTQENVDKAKQGAPYADTDWLKASGYEIPVKEYQDADIKVLSSFTVLPRWQLARSEMTVTEINHGAAPAQQDHALYDADGISYLFFLPEALGPKLGHAFLTAYEKGEIGKAAALIKMSEVSTSAAKSYFNYPRPFLIDQNTIRLVPDNAVTRTGAPYTATAGAFPSGHTNTGYTDALLLAEMLPERFTALVDRAAGYGYSRVVLGVHYPLDVIGSRMVVERNVSALLNDPAYQKLFSEAREELRTALEKECGTTIAQCAAVGTTAADPWAAAPMREFYNFTMTYDLQQSGEAGVAMDVPEGAEVLLATLFPHRSAEERREILKQTAIDSGYPLDSTDPASGFWQRIDLHEASLAK